MMANRLLLFAFILEVQQQVQAVQAITPRKFLLVTKPGTYSIHKIDLSTSKTFTKPINRLKNPIAVDYDPVEGRIYWTDLEEKTIRSAKDGGSNVRLVRQLGQEAEPYGLSLDSQSRLLFYTDLGNKVIGLITLYSKYNYHYIVIDSDIDVPRDIELDNGVMYWTDVGTRPKIERAYYDGTDRKILISGSKHLDMPVALALDKHGGRLYWADATAQLIGWTDLEGQSTGVIFRKPGSHFFGMDIYKNNLYVTDWKDMSQQAYIHQISTDGKTEKKFLTAFGRLNDIRYYGDKTQKKGTNACENNKGGCSYICVPTSPNTKKCLTPRDDPSLTPSKFLLVTKTGPTNIHRTDLSSSKTITIPIDGLKNPIAVDYDPVEDRIYWTDLEEKTIRSAKDGGSNVRLVRQLGQEAAPYGLSLDSQSRLLFYTDLGNKVIGLITLYSTYNYNYIVIDSDIDVPRDIELDKDNGLMYWSDVGVTPKIERVNYDGTDRKILVSCDMPVALALDKHGRRLYWADAAAQLIGWTDLEGQTTGVVYRKTDSRFFGMDFYKNDLYVTDWRNNSPQAAATYIYRINTDGKTEKKLLTAFGRLNDIRVYGDETQTKESNPCRVNKGGCSDICIPTSPNSNKCLSPNDSPSINPPKRFMLVTTTKPNAIKRIDISTQSTFVIPVDRKQNPMAVDYDPPNARIYWTDIKGRAIRSANLDGSDAKVVLQFNLGARPYGMSVDSLSRLIFYTDAGHHLIGLIGMSTDSYFTVIDSDTDMPWDIELDKHNGVMYWTDVGATPRIERANYDGTDRRILVSGSANLDLPHALALDRVGQRLYWADGETHLIGWTDVDGRNVREILRRPPSSFFGMDIYLNTLFVTDRTAQSQAEVTYIRRISTDGKRQDQVITVEGRLNDIRIYSEDTEEKGTNGCGRNNGGCDGICVPTPDNSNKCLCTKMEPKTEL